MINPSLGKSPQDSDEYDSNTPPGSNHSPGSSDKESPTNSIINTNQALRANKQTHRDTGAIIRQNSHNPDPLIRLVSERFLSGEYQYRHSSHLSSYEIRFDDLEIGDLLGGGSWGRVYKARYHETTVAVKILLKDEGKSSSSSRGNAESLLSMDNEDMITLENEVCLMAKLHHPHVVHLLGYTAYPAAIVQEYCSHGSLLSMLIDAKIEPSKAAELTWDRRVSIAIGTAKGMLYLHSQRPAPIIHRDLKAANVLITHDFTARVADFGLSKIMSEAARSSSLEALNPRWLAPEVLTGTPATPASDVYAFGVLLWELLTWNVPWGLVSTWSIVGAVGKGQRPRIPQSSMLPGPEGGNWPHLETYVELLQRCWAQNAEERPTFVEILGKFREIAPDIVDE